MFPLEGLVLTEFPLDVFALVDGLVLTVFPLEVLDLVVEFLLTLLLELVVLLASPRLAMLFLLAFV